MVNKNNVGLRQNNDGGGRLIREYCTETFKGETTTNTHELIYLYDDECMVGVRYSYNGAAPQNYFYVRNLHGDVVAIYNANGVKQAEYAYDAYGNCKVTNSTNSNLAYYNPIRYRGYYYDRETGLYHLNARYYNPEWRRFLSHDLSAYLDPESANGLNLYAYCENDPVNYVDHLGHFGIGLTLLIATGAGLALGFGIEAAKQAHNGGNWNWDLSTWNWWEIGKASLIGAATGFAYGLGGVAGGIIKGSFQALTIASKALTVSQSVGLLLGTAAVTNFAAGVAGYAMHTAGSKTESFNILKGISEGIGQTGKGILSFFTAGMYVNSGFWKVGVGAKNTFSSILGRSAGRFIANYIPNYIFENLF